MLQISSDIQIDKNEIQFRFIRASGPGGQNVNKVSTAVQLRFDITNSPTLAPEVKKQLIRLSGKQVNNYGILTIEARRYRTQEKNREDALNRFVKIIRKASEIPRKRIKTKPTISSQEKRLHEKKQKGETKRLRQNKSFE